MNLVSWIGLILIIELSQCEQSKNSTVALKQQKERQNIKSKEKNSYYTHPPNNFPMLAQITPLNEQNEPVGKSFSGYIYPTSISPFYYPYYSVLCRKEINSKAEDLAGLQSIEQTHLKPLSDNMKELSTMIKHLSSLIIKDTDVDSPSRDMSQLIDENPVEKPKIEEPAPKPFTTPLKENEKAKKKEQLGLNKDWTSGNAQSGVFQCEGVTCPQDAVSCRITEIAIEPTYDEILKTVYCLSGENETLLKIDDKSPNPNKGSSLNSSRTQQRNGAMNMMPPDFVNAMQNLENKMKIFRQF